MPPSSSVLFVILSLLCLATPAIGWADPIPPKNTPGMANPGPAGFAGVGGNADDGPGQVSSKLIDNLLGNTHPFGKQVLDLNFPTADETPEPSPEPEPAPRRAWVLNPWLGGGLVLVLAAGVGLWLIGRKSAQGQ